MVPSGGTQSGTITLPMAIQRYLEVALYLLVLTGFGTLASTGGLDLPTVMVVGGALLLRGYQLANRRSWLIPERWTTILTLLYVAFYVTDYFLISRAFLNSTVHLVLFVMVVRMFSAHRDRDRYFLAVLAFLMVLAAAVLTVDSVFLFAFAAFILVAVLTFVLMEMRHASSKATVQSRESGDTLAYRHMAFALSGVAPILLVLIVLGAGGIFFVLPRASAGYLSAYAPGRELSTGFSDRVQLGKIGQIQQSSSVVMHIQIDGQQGGNYNLKWRGITLNNFDGFNWSNTHEKFILPHQPDGSYALPQFGAEDYRRQIVRPIHYRVLMEPVGTNVFFLAATPRILEGNYREISVDRGGGVFDLDIQHPVIAYQASSILREAGTANLREASGATPAEILLNYLQLPAIDPRIPQLAEQITSSRNNNYDKAVAIETYLRSRFGYTLQLPRALPRDPLANFLFERKQGHCEYFASAMAVMLRTLHIPARIVNGFQTGEYNDLTSQYVIRASNAHSWVEAYFPGYGWVAFDPTPAALPEIRTGWSRALLYLDAMSSFWREWVVNYDSGHQQQLGQTATQGSRRLLESMRNWVTAHYLSMLNAARRVQGTVSEAPGKWTIGAVLATLLLLAAANARRLWNLYRMRRVATHPETAPQMAATIWYRRTIKVLAGRGWKKSDVQTPEEFLGCINDLGMHDRVARFTRHYEHARFGNSVEDARRLPELFEEICAAGRRD